MFDILRNSKKKTKQKNPKKQNNSKQKQKTNKQANKKQKNEIKQLPPLKNPRNKKKFQDSNVNKLYNWTFCGVQFSRVNISVNSLFQIQNVCV